MKLAPTGKCFDDAVEIMVAEYTSQPEEVENKMRLIHGMLMMEDGTMYSHAWLEDDEENIFEMILCDGERTVASFKREQFYKDRGVIKIYEYTIDEVRHHNALYGTTGPWVEELQSLTKSRATTGE